MGSRAAFGCGVLLGGLFVTLLKAAAPSPAPTPPPSRREDDAQGLLPELRGILSRLERIAPIRGADAEGLRAPAAAIVALVGAAAPPPLEQVKCNCPQCPEPPKSQPPPLPPPPAQGKLEMTHRGPPPKYTSAVHVNREEITNALPQMYQLSYYEDPTFSRTGREMGGILLRHREEWTGAGKSNDPFSPCGEVHVVFTSTEADRCVLITETHRNIGLPYFVERHCRGELKETPAHLGGETCNNKPGNPFRLVPRPSALTNPGFPLPGGWPMPGDEENGWRPLQSLIEKSAGLKRGSALDKLLERIARPSKAVGEKRNRGNVVVLATNRGNAHFVINWACSARAAGLDIKNAVVFCSDLQAKEIVEAAGLTAFWHDILTGGGILPKAASKYYGDGTFTSMMWLKSLSVFLTLRLGYNCLFQDADVVWFRDPWPLLDEGELGTADGLFQDDGARSTRFGPYFFNSGLFLVRATRPSVELFRQMLQHQHLVHRWASQQAVLNYVMHDLHGALGMSLKVLPPEWFPSGKQFHHEPHLMREFFEERQVPAIFHMCWTDGGKSKIYQLRAVLWWFMKQECSAPLTRTPGVDCCAIPLVAQNETRWKRYRALKEEQVGKKIVKKMLAQQPIKSRIYKTSSRREEPDVAGESAQEGVGIGRKGEKER
eukprot:Hpha_TRINITY_DN8016_c0_g1::TRINITY_DN8016_c0_g1_i2::g.140122::m.140122